MSNQRLKHIIFTFLCLFFNVQAERNLGDLCTTSGGQGECKLLNDCPKVQEEIKQSKFPVNCGFYGNVPIVCCPKSKRKPGEISREKCKEYAEFAYVTKTSPVLIPNAPKIRTYECGHEVVKLILGGQPAGKKEFPHMVALGLEQPSGELMWLCGGSLISEQYILTAAHCLSDPQQGNLTHVRMGIIDLTSTSKKKQDLKIAQLIAHHDYHYPKHYNDIGLVKLEKPARMNPSARPGCLYSQSHIDSEKAMATGWGDTTAEGGSSSNILLKVTLQLVDHATCSDNYKSHINRKLSLGIQQETQLCAKSDTDESKDTCRGDSGGPLQIYHDEKHAKCMYDVLGVTSFGRLCSGGMGVYVRVSRYVQWIEDIVWPEE